MSQNEKITQHLLKGKKLTALQALDKFGCFRLASRIREIRQGLPVKTEMIKTKSGARIARYSISA